jgi:hypothetical protein
LLVAVLIPAGGAQAAPKAVDESRLQPALSPTFVPWDCKLKSTGPVCTGERHLRLPREQVTDFACTVPLWNSRTEDRYQIRYYNEDYLNFDRRFRTKDTDFFSTSLTGPDTATIDTHVRFTEPYAVPGDDSTRTIISSGTILEIRGATGRALLRVVGTLVEAPDAPATFSGHVTVDGVTTRYVDGAYDSIVPFELFADAVCQAATGSGTTL